MKIPTTKIEKSFEKGFTLIETLVAITILMISIVGPLTIASKGLTAAANSRDQVIASYLAQDLMEYIKNVRDGSLLPGGGGWTAFINKITNSNPNTCNNLTQCGLETSPDGILANSNTIDCLLSRACRLYQVPSISGYTYYSYVSNSSFVVSKIPTQFSRSFYPTRLSTDSVLLTVIVSWREGLLYNQSSSQVVLKSVLFNTPR